VSAGGVASLAELHALLFYMERVTREDSLGDPRRTA
jgi:hypothetical protein